MRDDHITLESLGVSEADRRGMGLWEPATAEPGRLMDAYLRRSNKKEDLAALRGQLLDLVNYAQREGLQIRHVWFEQLSASKVHVRRLEFEKATQAVLDGKSKRLAVWRTDRADRRGMGAVGRLLDELERRNARLVSVSEGMDSTESTARMRFAIMSEMAREETKTTSKRVKMGHDAHKKEGRRGTGKPPFGLYSARGSGKVEPHEAEYPTARRLADLLLAGNTTVVTAHILNGEGHRTRSGATWSGTAVSKLAQSPVFAGMVPVRQRKQDEHGNALDVWEGYGEPLMSPDGKPVMCGTGVVTASEWYRIRAAIAERTDPKRRAGKPAAKYLLTGILRCGRCEGPMSHRGGRYRCDRRQQRGTAVCAGVVALAERVDVAVATAWAHHVSSLEPDDEVLYVIARRWLAFQDPEAQAAREGAADALASAQKMLRKLETDYYLKRKISEESYEEMSVSLSATIETMSAQLDALDRSADMTVFTNRYDVERAWNDPQVTTDVQRMLLRCALRSVTIQPAARQGDTSPIKDRLDVDWISADG